MAVAGQVVTDMSILPVREIRDRHVDRAQPPASTAVQVVSLFRPGYLVEIDDLAVGILPVMQRLPAFRRNGLP